MPSGSHCCCVHQVTASTNWFQDDVINFLVNDHDDVRLGKQDKSLGRCFFNTANLTPDTLVQRNLPLMHVSKKLQRGTTPVAGYFQFDVEWKEFLCEVSAHAPRGTQNHSTFAVLALLCAYRCTGQTKTQCTPWCHCR
eukprot:m.1357059 g.1357059  ORF g.1357059 m.1357059 type:complete len:138 (+) comp24933_c0_seq70:5495-5908(+)